VCRQISACHKKISTSSTNDFVMRKDDRNAQALYLNTFSTRVNKQDNTDAASCCCFVRGILSTAGVFTFSNDTVILAFEEQAWPECVRFRGRSALAGTGV